ncbi:MAG: capsule assembly Wzi family protein [Rhodothermia bacterium]|nr:MAG: capsule assembly Wzi family protein [Rhodothermia bacterium]
MSCKKSLLFYLFIIGFSTHVSRAQRAPGSFVAEAFVSGSSEDVLPFWLTANQYGVQDPEGSNASARLASTVRGGETDGLAYRIGFDAVARSGKSASLFLQQLYGELSLGAIRLRAGRTEERIGLVHPRLSIGSMTLSRNAAPITKISISMPDFVDVPGTKGFVGFRGGLANGWMSGNRVVKNAFVHEKYLFLRFGSSELPVRFNFGLTHFNNWGGTHMDPEIGELPSGFNDFLRVFFARPADSSTVVESETTNVLGNALGAYDGSFEFFFIPAVKLSMYHQFYLEDTVSLRLRSWRDGIWGIALEFENRPAGIRSVLWEHVYTKQQGSRSFERRGTDNYYNHVLYASGWTHRGRALGLPLALTAEGFGGVINNILVAQHVGIEGMFAGRVRYTALITYSRNYGVHDYFDLETLRHVETDLPLERRDQVSILLDLRSRISSQYNLDGILRVAYDWGDLLPDNNLGLTLGVTHRADF